MVVGLEEQPSSYESLVKAVVLLSGGLDSAVTAAEARHSGFEVYALTLRYGQRHAVEVAAAERLARTLGVARHVVITVDLGTIADSALTSGMAMPTGRSAEEIGRDIPATYVPARNTVFLALALSWAESLGAFDLFIGVNALDYSGYPDCRPEYLEAFERLARLATKAGVEGTGHFTIHAPFLQSTKAAIVRRGLDLGVDLSATISCYAPGPDGTACGVCDACVLRAKAFAEAGVPDPALQRTPHSSNAGG
jgi:7-cyano-7-deazaguanine synthase